MSNPAGITQAPPPWKLKATVYSFLFYTTASDAIAFTSDASVLYSLLELDSPFSVGRFSGGLGMVQVIRYSESPVGPYDELLIVPGKYEYQVEKDGKREIKENLRLTKIFVSNKETCWNGRVNWNIPKHLAHFKFEDLPNGGGLSITVEAYESELESVNSPRPFFSAVFKPTRFVPSFPSSTNIAKYVGLDLSLVQPPLPEGPGKFNELPGTDRWCQVHPYEYSGKTSIGWWDLKQKTAESDGASKYENWLPGFGRWRMGIKMEDTLIDFPEPTVWPNTK